MCNSCQAVNINGINCHELGCPDLWLNPLTNEPLPTECVECGSLFVPDHQHQQCCDQECATSYRGF